ncbi:docking protein 2-like isoform X1 [Anguilla rostrata]|uniref:docking protein 2-like isoform X1 n=1 Tax=Anguilla rostrata TaxID=7938 RepID=UPI0030D303DC
MEEEVRKSGILYLQQQKFGKKWKKVWSLVYGDSGCSVSRLELFECRDDAERAELKRSKRDSRKVIRMSDFVRVAEKKATACPRGCGTFLVETAGKSFLFASETSELGDWIRTLCEIAFPQMNQGQGEAFMTPSVQDSGMVDNDIYCSSSALKEFHVMVKKTEASVRCKLNGPFVLRVDPKALHLQDPQSRVISFSWPYQYIRKFGLTMSCFTFEAGRKSDSGEGLFELQTTQNNKIFQAVDTAIGLQSKGDGCPASNPGPAPGCRPIATDDDDGDGLYSKVKKTRRPRAKVDALLAGVEDLVLEDNASVRGWGGAMAGRPLPPPAPDPEPSPVSKARPGSQELSEAEPDYEEVDAGPMAPGSHYHNVDQVKGQASIVGGAADPCNPGVSENHGPRQLKRMLTNPCYHYDEVDAGPVTDL